MHTFPKWLREAIAKQRHLRQHQPRITSREAQEQFDRVMSNRPPVTGTKESEPSVDFP